MIIEEIKKYFTRDKMVRDTLVSFIFICAGLMLFIALFLLAALAERGGDLYYLMENAGFFFVFASIVLAYAAIHRGNVSPGNQSVRSLITDTVRQAHLIIGILIGSLLVIFIMALVEVLLSFFGYIPYAGPVFVALLSLPLFIINCAVISAVVMIWIVTPAMFGEGVALKKMPMDYITLMRKRGLVIFGYTMLTLVILLIMFTGVLMIIRYAAGITRAAQWNITPAYPPIFKSIIRSSYITDVIVKIAPRTDPIASLQQYGTSIFNYLDMLGALLKILYGIVLAAIAAFFLAIFFNVLSFFYVLVKKDVLK